MKNKFIYLAILAAGFASCEPEFENEVDANYTSGDADFTSYVAIGNSLTAGYMDGTVSRVGQTYSFPNLLAQKFALVGGGAFTQPSYEDDASNLGGLMLFGNQIGSTRLVIDISQGRPENLSGTPSIEVSNLQATAYNNMGVPGAKSFHLVAPGYGNLAGVALGQSNPYFVRHATSPSATVLGDAMTKNPTFFTNWIGANDVLSYATNGGAKADGVTPATDHNITGNMNPATYGSNDITNSNLFAGVYSNIINTLTSNGAKGVVATIPSVTSIPYFTTVPYNALPAEATATNATAIALYQFLSVATGGRISPLNTTPGSKNPVLIKDTDLTNISATIQAYAAGSGNSLLMANAAALGAIYGQARHATAEDLFVLPSSSIIGQENPAGTAPFNVNGVTLPLANKWVLTTNEKVKVVNATSSYNAAIRSIAASKGLAVADMNLIMNQLVSGLRIDDGTIYTANYFSPTTASSVLFSLDGVHPNPRGYAVIANEIIKVINNHYHANIPIYSPANFPGISIVPSN
ncbi:G-D-S-L family lipolytic protein [Flavobacterium channae]|uniref:G-D-S-L family lipolytic protein n=1 Tax=Flavobacterium channae TaxID=2897181 RepID=UPI001E4BEC78|nr:G-D-S-L family lipolytic protein [Flavobacterium channae]UGS23291.1 G-D-S-L family lipolytic protein [Flavobacterium channae]